MPLVASLLEAQRRRIPAFLGLREGRYGQPQPIAELRLFEEENRARRSWPGERLKFARLP